MAEGLWQGEGQEGEAPVHAHPRRLDRQHVCKFTTQLRQQLQASSFKCLTTIRRRS